MAYTDIDKPSDYFSATLYTANGTARTIATGHQSDWVWLKRRDGVAGHRIADSVRGVNKLLYSDSSTSEQSASNTITGFVSTGFTLGDDSGGYDVNTSSNTMVAWSWKAGTSFTNDASSTGIGTIDSTGSVNDTAGFSIISYTGTGSNGSIKHGMSTAPRAMLFKNRDEGAEGWFVYHESVGNTKRAGLLNETGAASTSSTFFQDTSPTSSIITLGSNHGCNGPDAMICYAFSERKGYSKFGSYTGNGNADGTFIYTGFKPAWVMVKQTNSTGNWVIWDSTRQPENLLHKRLYANLEDAEYAGDSIGVDFLSNGFKHRSTVAEWNGSGNTMIYMAFAENPFTTSSGIPACAR